MRKSSILGLLAEIIFSQKTENGISKIILQSEANAKLGETNAKLSEANAKLGEAYAKQLFSITNP